MGDEIRMNEHTAGSLPASPRALAPPRSRSMWSHAWVAQSNAALHTAAMQRVLISGCTQALILTCLCSKRGSAGYSWYANEGRGQVSHLPHRVAQKGQGCGVPGSARLFAAQIGRRRQNTKRFFFICGALQHAAIETKSVGSYAGYRADQRTDCRHRTDACQVQSSPAGWRTVPKPVARAIRQRFAALMLLLLLLLLLPLFRLPCRLHAARRWLRRRHAQHGGAAARAKSGILISMVGKARRRKQRLK